jgi:hypothetical protein
MARREESERQHAKGAAVYKEQLPVPPSLR